MSRTSPNAVMGILGGNYNGNTPLDPFIDAANNLTTQVASIASQNKGLVIGSTTLEIIERYLAAHFYGFQDQFFQSKSTGRANATFQGQTGMCLDSTQYGQTAMLMDTTRTLAALNKGGFVGINWLGTPYDNCSDTEGDEVIE